MIEERVRRARLEPASNAATIGIKCGAKTASQRLLLGLDLEPMKKDCGESGQREPDGTLKRDCQAEQTKDKAQVHGIPGPAIYAGRHQPGTALRMQRINGSADLSKDTDAQIRDGESAQRNGTSRHPGK